MSTLISKRTRKGSGVKVVITTGHGSTESVSEYFEVDKLNTKQTEEARDNYEKVFIAIREHLEGNTGGQLNIDSETARLTLCQDISDILRKASLIRKEEK
tara:strand:- start:12 stop:311 length:300 start_codon:yes stop_codon:yes gene_type:complete